MDNKQELISVIVPVYNDEQYLPRCLDSLIAQSYNNIEIIVIDDGSQDKSGNICDDYANKDNRINVIHQDYLGVSGARNTGLKNVTGKYIAFLDGDDEADTEYIGKLYETLLNNDLDIENYSKRNFLTVCHFLLGE